MSRKKPDRRLIQQRSSDNDKRRPQDPAPSEDFLAALAERASFEGYSKHKRNPRAFGLDPFNGDPGDSTFCDSHASFLPADMSRVPELLRRGILAGLVGSTQDNSGDPTMVWTVDDNGWIYEARITHPGRAVYHGYPVLPTEAIARLVIARFTEHAYRLNDPKLKSIVQNAQKRYP